MIVSLSFGKLTAQEVGENPRKPNELDPLIGQLIIGGEK